MIKPRIRRSYFGSYWVCFVKGCLGYGLTPKEAYKDWLRLQ